MTSLASGTAGLIVTAFFKDRLRVGRELGDVAIDVFGKLAPLPID
jgi:hypothetical protein